MIVDIETLGQMDNSDGTFESANRVYSSNGVSPTIPNCGGGGGLQPKVLDICIGGMQEHQAIKTDGISTTLTSSMGTGGGYVPMVIESKEENDINKWVWEVDGVKYLIRIRKLTPKECWRLMSFSDEDYEKAAEVNSNTQLYKQAGNSICSCVMESLFKELLKE